MSVIVVTDADTARGGDIARALANMPAPAVLVLAGVDTDVLAGLAAELGSTGARVAVLVDDVATRAGQEALTEMVNELFPQAKS